VKFKMAVAGIGLGVLAGMAGATPSTVFWTPCSIDIQAYKSVHLSYDTYFTVAEKGGVRGGSAFPVDMGLTMGVLPFDKFQAEVGFDWFEPTDYPLVLNAKMGFPEGAMFTSAPALQVGIFNAGVKKDATDMNAIDVVTGMTLPMGVGRIHLGAYTGKKELLTGSEGKAAPSGFMAAWDLSLLPVVDGSYSRLGLCADWMSGKNVLGGGGPGAAWYFSKNASILTGPVWFNDEGLNGKWKWTVQFDANF